jgi:hypothetical protein
MQGQICDILRPKLAMKGFLSLWPHRFPHFGYIHLGGGGPGGGGGMISDHVEHSTNLQVSMPTSGGDWEESQRKEDRERGSAYSVSSTFCL